jgi:diacylglycerol kinase family enzyme
MRYAFVLNPAARNGRAGRLRVSLEQALRAKHLPFTYLETEERGHATELAREAAQSHDVVVAVGGDGTVQEVARGVLGTDAVMGIIPAGTGNDFAKAIGMPLAFDKALSAMLSADTVVVDVGLIRWQERGEDGLLTEHDGTFTNCVGTGFDAAAAKATHRYKALGGRLAYVAAVFETLWKWRKPDVEVEIRAGGMVEGGQKTDEERLTSQIPNPKFQAPSHHPEIRNPKSEIDDPKPEFSTPISEVQSTKTEEPTLIHTGSLFLIEIDNGFSVGGGFLLTPNAQIDDGLFDVCFVEHLTIWRALHLMPKTFSGAHVGEPEVQLFQARSVHINSSAPLPVQADGEILSTSAVSLDVEIVPAALHVRAPKLRRPTEGG